MMNERLKEVRKSVGLKQSEFAERLGLTQSYLSILETGKSPLIDNTIKLICVTFKVSETWFRTGTGSMLADSPVTATFDDQEFFSIYNGLLPEVREVLKDTAKSLLCSQAKLLKKQLAM